MPANAVNGKAKAAYIVGNMALTNSSRQHVNQYCQTIRTDEINTYIEAFLLPTYVSQKSETKY